MHLNVRRPHDAVIGHDLLLAPAGANTADLRVAPVGRPVVHVLERDSAAAAPAAPRVCVSEPVGRVVLVVVVDVASRRASAVPRAPAVLGTAPGRSRPVPPVLPARAAAEPGRQPPA